MVGQSLAGYRILIIEDDVQAAHQIQRALQTSGAACQWAGDAIGGLTDFKVEEPHLVLLSLNAPGMHGYDVCRVMREVSYAPIFLLMNHVSREAEIQGLKAGADGVLTKPLDSVLLCARIEAQLRRVYQYDAPPAEEEILQETTEPIESQNELAPGWVGCQTCDYEGPKARFERLTSTGTPYLTCPFCGETKNLLKAEVGS